MDKEIAAFRQSGEIDERQWSYSGIYYTLFIKKEVSYTVFRYQMIQNRAEIKQTFGAVALFVNRNHLVSSGTFYTYYTRARVCEKNMQCTYCTFCTRRAVHNFFVEGSSHLVDIWKISSCIYQPVSSHPAAEYHCKVLK